MIINKGPHHRIQDLVLFCPQKIKLKKSSPIIGKFSNRPFFTRYFRLTCLLFFTLMAFFGRGIVLALKELSSVLDSLISLLPPLICIFKVSSAQRKKVSLKTVAQPHFAVDNVSEKIIDSRYMMMVPFSNIIGGLGGCLQRGNTRFLKLLFYQKYMKIC